MKAEGIMCKGADRTDRMTDMKFEWDDEKAKKNLRKHKVSFEMAKYVFNDDNRLEYEDNSHSSGEERYVTIGMVENVLYVVYTMRGEYTRLISAREATRLERSVYYEGISEFDFRRKNSR